MNILAFNEGSREFFSATERSDGQPNCSIRDSIYDHPTGAGSRTRTKQRSVWSIGIYTGNSPLRLSADPSIKNPVITSREVNDVQSDFVADPFMIKEQNTWFMFFEVMNRDTHKGEIGLATSGDVRKWNYHEIVLREPYHLSYPYVFKWEDEFFMLPETSARGSVQLYRAKDFPTRWELAGRMLDSSFTDPSIIHLNGKWWLFACASPQGHDTLRLYYADDLMGHWHEHPKSPIVEGDKRRARPAGRVLNFEGRIFRFAQDCFPRYGSRVRAFEITELTAQGYTEQEVSESPVLSATGDDWNSSGMHHLDPHRINCGEWIACVDGRYIEQL